MRRRWSQSERKAVEYHLAKFFRLQKVPGKRECSDCLSKAGSELENRTWKDVKYYVYNHI